MWHTLLSSRHRRTNLSSTTFVRHASWDEGFVVLIPSRHFLSLYDELYLVVQNVNCSSVNPFQWPTSHKTKLLNGPDFFLWTVWISRSIYSRHKNLKRILICCPQWVTRLTTHTMMVGAQLIKLAIKSSTHIPFVNLPGPSKRWTTVTKSTIGPLFKKKYKIIDNHLMLNSFIT